MLKIKINFLIFLALILSTWSAWAQEDPYQIELASYQTQNPDQPILVVLDLFMAPQWHCYGHIQGPAGFPTQIQGQLENQSLTTIYPLPQLGSDPMDPQQKVDLYTGQTSFFILVSSSGSQSLSITLDALLCSSTACQPVHEQWTLDLPPASTLPLAEIQPWYSVFIHALAQDSTSPSPDQVNLLEQAAEPWSLDFKPRYFAPGLEVKTLSKAAVFAFLAGLILNFMPCVLPVITLKLRSFIPLVDNVPQIQRQTFSTHNIFFALGIILYFLVLAIIIASTGMVWGQIFQKPGAIITLTCIVFALSLSLFGIYDLPLIDLKGKVQQSNRHPKLESFTTGILATILATPCSGPLLGGVLAWALIQPPEIIALVLTCVGLGMAAPYLIMAMFPGLYRYLPRPGAWTIHLERFLGFLLAATCIYLLSLVPVAMYLKVLIFLWIIAVAAWIWGQGTNLAQSWQRRWSIRGSVLTIMVLTAFFIFRPQEELNPWMPLDLSTFEQQLGQENMILEFTADWCPNCKFLEKAVLTPQLSARLAHTYKAKLYQVDLTRHDPQLMALLDSLGSKSIPILAIFSKEKPDSPLILRDLFTSGQLKNAVHHELGQH